MSPFTSTTRCNLECRAPPSRFLKFSYLVWHAGASDGPHGTTTSSIDRARLTRRQTLFAGFPSRGGRVIFPSRSGVFHRHLFAITTRHVHYHRDDEQGPSALTAVLGFATRQSPVSKGRRQLPLVGEVCLRPQYLPLLHHLGNPYCHSHHRSYVL